MEYIEIKEQIKQKLPVARDLGDSENLLELGLSSLTIMRLVNQWRKQGVKVSFGSLMENPTLEGWWALIQRSMKKKAGTQHGMMILQHIPCFFQTLRIYISPIKL